MITTKNKALINLIIDLKKQKGNAANIKYAVTELKKTYSFDKLSVLTGMGVSTLSYYIHARPKRDKTQSTHRIIRSGIDLDVLIRHFQCYVPQSASESEQMKKLCLVLMECSKKRRFN